MKSTSALSRVGLGYRAEFAEVFASGSRPELSWIEVVTENFLPVDGRETRALQNLKRLRRDFPVALHGVSLSLAAAEPVREETLANLVWLEKEIEPFLVSDHLCWTGVGGENLFDLLPFPYNEEALAWVAPKIELVQERLRRPLVLENITFYAEPAGGEMSEAEFLRGLVERTGCKILLDLNNIFVNARNFSRDPLECLRAYDLRSVAQIHLAGHGEGRGGLLIDTHGAPVREEVWEMLAWTVARTGPVPAMIERDENIPAWSEMAKELARLHEILAGKENHAEPPRLARELSR